MARAIHVFRTPDRFVAGTVGQPGNRTFYIQAVGDSRVVSVVLEKQQVAVLAERIGALLLEVNRRFGTPVPPEPAEIDDYDRRRAALRPYRRQRSVPRWGEASSYGWSEDKARQYADPARADFGAFVRAKGFRLD